MTYYHFLTRSSTNKFWNKVEVTKAVLENYVEMDISSLNLTADSAARANQVKDMANIAIDYLLDTEYVRLIGLDLALEKLSEIHELRRRGYNDES